MERPKDANAPSLQRSSLQTTFPMATGDGKASYSKNSHIQGFITKLTMPALDEALETMNLSSTTGAPVCVADLGGSSGPNTIENVADIVDKLSYRLPEDTEFQAYFNDLPSNDFNNLFQLLSKDARAKNFYAAGVPGNFYDRLFPQSSVHVFHSANSLHWLSRVPDVVVDEGSPAYNRGEAWYHHSAAVTKSYQKQALIDLTSFFQARAAELVSGGLLFFLMNGGTEPNEVQNDVMIHYVSILNETVSGLVAEGLLTERQHDNFNIPIYCRSGEDIREALKCCESLFSVVKLKLYPVDLREGYTAVDPSALPKTLTALVRAGLSHQVEAHFGKRIGDIIWERVGELIGKRAGLPSYNLNLQIAWLIRN